MLSEKILNKINDSIKDHKFTYTGQLTREFNGDIDFKIELLGYKQMIRIGNWEPYLQVKVIILDARDMLSKIIFSSYNEMGKEKFLEMVEKSLYVFNYGLEDYLKSVMRFFQTDDTTNIRISDFEVRNNNLKDGLMEQRSSRQMTRNMVRDIVNLLKNKEKGDFQLPEEIYYSTTKYPIEISLEIELKHNSKIDGYKMNANFIPDDEIIEILIIYNPKKVKQNLYNIIGELNEIITHELEHGSQLYKGEFDYDVSDDITPYEYYTQPHEIPAQIKGFKRLAKLRKIPFEQVVRDWFTTHRDIHHLSKDEEEQVIAHILSEYTNSL